MGVESSVVALLFGCYAVVMLDEQELSKQKGKKRIKRELNKKPEPCHLVSVCVDVAIRENTERMRVRHFGHADTTIGL